MSTPEVVTESLWGKIHGIAISRALSSFGTVVTIWALIFRERSEGPVALSMMFVAAGLPYILLGPWVGWIADRFSTRQIIPVVSVIQGALTLVFLNDIPFEWVLALIFLYNVFAAIENPAWQALIPRVTKPEDISRAFGFTMGYFSAANIASPVVAGILVGTTGYVWPFIIDAISFGLLALVPFLLGVNRPGHQFHEEKKESPSAGYRLLWSDPLLRGVTAMLTVFILAIGAVNTGEVFLIMNILGANETTYGVIAALWSAGNLVGSAILGWKTVAENRQPKVLVLSVWVVGTGVLVIALSPNLWFVAVANALAGIGGAVLHTLATTILMSKATEAMRGRVSAAFSGIVNFGNLIATAFAGIAIASFGVREVMVVSSIFALLSLLIWGVGVYRTKPEAIETNG